MALAVVSLGACVVVPVDPRTGQPYPTGSRDAVYSSGYAVSPVAPAA